MLINDNTNLAHWFGHIFRQKKSPKSERRKRKRRKKLN